MTALVAYYRCSRCGNGWQVPRLESAQDQAGAVGTVTAGKGWLPIETLARIDSSPDRQGRSLMAALAAEGGGAEWVASTPGEQVIVVRFHQPQDVQRVRLVFVDTERERTQEFALWGSSHRGETHREILRRQFTFSPRGATRYVEECPVKLAAASWVELRITPDIHGFGAFATVREFRLG